MLSHAGHRILQGPPRIIETYTKSKINYVKKKHLEAERILCRI
jgi:hypothetical protein